MIDHALVPQLKQKVLAGLNMPLLHINGSVGSDTDIAANQIGAELLDSLDDREDIALIVVRSVVVWQSQVDVGGKLDARQLEPLNVSLRIQICNLGCRNLRVRLHGVGRVRCVVVGFRYEATLSKGRVGAVGSEGRQC